MMSCWSSVPCLPGVWVIRIRNSVGAMSSSRAMGAVIILMCVGALIRAWISAGTVRYDLCRPQIRFPSLFLVTSLILCSVTSLTTGTSWVDRNGRPCHHGIGAGLGFDPGIITAYSLSAVRSSAISFPSPIPPIWPLRSAGSIAPACRHMVNTIARLYHHHYPVPIIGFKQGSGVADIPAQCHPLRISEHFQIGIIPALPTCCWCSAC